MIKISILIASLLFLSACSDIQNEKKEKSATSGMKCGAGKCGANMFDGKGDLAKKKRNVLKQMREEDPRKECVKSAKNTKEVYACVRSPKTKKLTLKCGSAHTTAMKCGSSKCGSK